MFDLKKKAPGLYEIPVEGGMNVPGLVVASEDLLKEIAIDRPLEQVRNVAYLPGIVGHSIGMPDIHWGYGFPIGGVAAMDTKTGVISPGGVGYDINCGVRLAVLPFSLKDLTEQNKEKLLKKIFQLVPSGVGQGQKNERPLTEQDYRHIAEKGAKWSIELGFGMDEDLERMESNGCIQGADIQSVSPNARKRGERQLGSIGSGNHFVEIGEIQHIHDTEKSTIWGLEEKQTYLLIHSGSRGFGHQVCQDTLDSFIQQGFHKHLPDKQLVAAPIQSDAGQKYFRAMATAANYAFNNRQRILHEVRIACKEVLGISHEDIHMIYDVCHNIAKFETHEVDGKKRELCVHRKGATRAFGPGHSELSPLFQKTGQPVMVPGDMGRASYILAGLGNPLTFASSCHGAGRARSRVKSRQHWKGVDVKQHMEEKGVHVMATSYRTITEEMPDAYKDVDQVVAATEEAGLATIVARLKPRLVIKG